VVDSLMPTCYSFGVEFDRKLMWRAILPKDTTFEVNTTAIIVLMRMYTLTPCSWPRTTKSTRSTLVRPKTGDSAFGDRSGTYEDGK